MLLASLDAGLLAAAPQAISVDFDATFLVQFVLFAGLTLVLKPLLFDPMLKLFEERERRIDGAKMQARKIDEKSASALTKYETEMAKARATANAERDQAFNVMQNILQAHGDVQAMFAIIPAVLPQVKAGKLKALAVTGLRRSAIAPEVPSVAELGYPQLESLAWIGLLAPAGTPAEIVNRLQGEGAKAMRAPETRELLGKQGFDVVAGTPAEFSAWIRAEQAKWSKVIRASGATAD